MHDSDTYTRGAFPSIVERFEITNLHGYRTLILESPTAATILIAQNGAGKTTLLNALNAFLKGQFLRLKELNFTEIKCRLAKQETDLILTKQDILSISDLPIESEILSFAKKNSIEPRALVDFLTIHFGVLRDNLSSITDHPVYDAALRGSEYNSRATLDNLEKLQTLLFSYNNNITKAITAIRSALKDIEVIYLPTYRRIENPLIADEDNRHRVRGSRFKIPLNMFSGDIQFGLSDISERLRELNQKILFESDRGYRKLSADIIKEMLDGSFDRSDINDFYLPNTEDLNLFLLRLKEGRRRGPSFGDFSIPDIDKLLDPNSLQSSTNRFLLYFISKLNTVMKATKDIENQVESFVTKCNQYLSSNESGFEKHGHYSSDTKELRLNRADLSVYAVSIPSERQITLDALSSGEKQMISLLAKLYLYPKQKIVLVDEPELSLSIDWQKKILEDVISAPTCSQLVAITHSPFVFDNPLEPFARSLKISVDENRIPDISEPDEIDGEPAI